MKLAQRCAKASKFFGNVQRLWLLTPRPPRPRLNAGRIATQYHSSKGRWVNGGAALSSSAQYTRGFAQAVLRAWHEARDNVADDTKVQSVDAFLADVIGAFTQLGLYNCEEMVWFKLLCSGKVAIKQDHLPGLVKKG